eukprot:TRINITY_DN6190_c0_g1_i2.p1 TRINITY_DN6190_c0_g1~~TRINITY_DN6190_c0_g1_i2.p1  ORF type:complete len:141 (-),score=4.20 TRINITY_DN6190_c0_g1_i2:27-449(-)
MKQQCPPEVFGIVESGIYRCNSLSPINFPFIKQLQLKSVIQLSPEVPTKAVTSFFQENNIEHIHLGLKIWKPDATWKPVTEELIKEALEYVLDVRYHPIMVMCASGPTVSIYHWNNLNQTNPVTPLFQNTKLKIINISLS